jgi:beta-lactamase superfamily II metal-dependent hydrolase
VQALAEAGAATWRTDTAGDVTVTEERDALSVRGGARGSG